MAVAARLGLSEDHRSWLVALAAEPPLPLAVPRPEAAAAALRRLGLEERDVAAALTALRATDQPEYRWLLERAASRTVRVIGHLGEDSAPWPQLPDRLGEAGRCFWILVHLLALPETLRWHRRRGISAEVSWATLADLGRHVSLHRRCHGTTGLDQVRWIGNHFGGSLYQLGRLQYQLYRLHDGTAGPLFWYDGDPARLEPGLRPGDPALALHVPETGPLLPEACDASFRQARRFFPHRFPEHAYRAVTCTSWLLDEQLADYLPADSNILRFQRRFQILPGGWEQDDDIFWFVFKTTPAAIGQLRPRTRLERAIVEHVRGGRHWQVRTGWLELNAGGPP